MYDEFFPNVFEFSNRNYYFNIDYHIPNIYSFVNKTSLNIFMIALFNMQINQNYQSCARLVLKGKISRILNNTSVGY